MMLNEVTYGKKSFQPGVQLEAVKLVLERGVSAAQAARDLGMHQHVVNRWMREARADQTR